ncbi:MAG: ABC transporter permease [Rhodocyclaceae bacterium]
MRSRDLAAFAVHSLTANPVRSALTVLAMAIGVAAVVVLTALGEAARSYVVGQFSALGSHLLIVFPGRTETSGTFPGALTGATPRDLTLDDALALTRPHAVRRIAPLTIGSATVSWGRRSREVAVLGSTSELMEIRRFAMAQGRFLPVLDPRRAQPAVVLGSLVRDELFGPANAVGEWLRVGERRYRVVGVLARQGQSLGFNTDELVILPVASAQALFNQASLLRILVEARSREEIPAAKAAVIEVLKARHEGEQDVTVVTQDALLATFDRILRALTLAVGGIAAISLAVAGILIMNVMLIAVSQRTREIGLLKALGAAPGEIRAIFLAEALLLCAGGAGAGLVLGQAGTYAIGKLYPMLSVAAPAWASAAALATALVTGVVFSVAPARRAAKLDPVVALYRR